MKRSELLFAAAKPPLDYLALIFSALVAYFIRYLPATQKIRPVIFDLSFEKYFGLTCVIAILWLGIFALSGLYHFRSTKKFYQDLGRIFVACSAGLALVLAVMVFTRYLFDSRFIILTTWALAIIFVSLERLMINLGQKIAYKVGFGVHRIVIIGDGAVASDLVKEFNDHPVLGYKVVEKFAEFDKQTLEKMKMMAENDAIDEIIKINPNFNPEQTIDLINFISDYHLDFRYTADLLGTQLTNLEVTTYAGTPVIEVKRTRLDGWGRIYKRIFDIIGSLIITVLLSPLMLIISFAIKLDSKGPIFFKYKRIGQYGKPFTYFKFRSMIENAHYYRFDPEFIAQHQNLRQGSPMMKFKNDPRITKVGKIIRRLSLDELPELFLVLAGKMSLVGPRPHEIQEVENYQRHQKKVLTIKPGISGLAQVSGRSDLDFEEEVKLDIFYVETWSLGLDLQILFKTPLAVIKRRQAE